LEVDVLKADRRTTMKLALMGTGAALAAPALGRLQNGSRSPADFDDLTVRHRTIRVDGLDIFYREAGRPDAPAVLLLHGFPTSSHMFRHLMPALADRYRLVAPDYPGYGYSSFPSRDQFHYSFANLARIIASFTEAVGLSRYALYIQDYGAPVGLRLALERPNAIAALITQNGNAYEEGLSPLWAPLKSYWAEPSNKNREALRGWLNAAGVRLQYAAGVAGADVERLAPDSWTLDWGLMQRPGNIDMQLDLFGDYRTNIELYPRFQQFFRTRRPPTLVLWGKNDPFFTVAGARAFLRDLPNAEVELVEASHFLLETNGAFAAHRIGRFLASSLG
jgi:pimeloyl-ACP methyl ester carboxylesterase